MSLLEAMRKWEPIKATAEMCRAPWSGSPKNFRCGFCGARIHEGSEFYWLFTNDLHGAGGNPLVCSECHGPREELREQWAAKCQEWRDFVGAERWWFFRTTQP